jgi:predicted Fe-Mo cluster-binding NifX family protein
VATADVRKSITFCRQVKLPVLGVVENMSGFACPACGTVTDIFKSGGGERMAADMGVPFLGRIPIDAAVGEACDDGKPFIYHHHGAETAKAFERVVTPILALSDKVTAELTDNTTNEGAKTAMKIAIPVVNGKLCMHFGHCDQFALLDVDAQAKKVTGQRRVTPPPHEPGVLPRWLHQEGATVIIAGGRGQRAQTLFAENGIQVVVGAPAETPEQLAALYLAGTLISGANVCDH